VAEGKLSLFHAMFGVHALSQQHKGQAELHCRGGGQDTHGQSGAHTCVCVGRSVSALCATSRVSGRYEIRNIL
jgi:hypothetical protein